MIKEESKTAYFKHTAQEDVTFMEYLQYFRLCRRVLDVGCGTGWLGKYKKGMFGVDIDAGAVKQAKKHEKARVSSVDSLPFSVGFFDGLIAKDILEHTRDNVKAVKEWRRVIKKGSLIFISVPYYKSRSFYDDYTHVRPYTKKSLTLILEDNGFEIVRFWYSCSLPGMGLLNKLFRSRRLPLIARIVAFVGILRENCNVIARKI